MSDINETTAGEQDVSALQAIDPKSIVVKSKEAKTLQTMVDEETEKRAILTAFISKHMVDGTDYGKIHISKACPDKYNCKNPHHFSKPSLFKPGAEKFTSLMKLRAVYEKDTSTYEMLGSQAGTVCYICKLTDSKGIVIGEGRGAASVAEKGSPNVAIKLAEKRAKVDAVLSSGGLSDFFTQDLEDMNVDVMGQDVAPRRGEQPKDVKTAPATRPANKMVATSQQRKTIMALLTAKGKDVDSLKVFFSKAFGIKSSAQLTLDQAEETIKTLRGLPDPQPIDMGQTDSERIADEVDAGLKAQGKA